MGYKLEDAIEFDERSDAAFQITNDIEFGDAKFPVPKIAMHHDDAQYYDPGLNEIHLGRIGIFDLFSPEDEAEYQMFKDYVRGHESQHRWSTVPARYSEAILHCAEAVVAWIFLQLEGYACKWHKESEYRYYVETTLPKKHQIYLSWQILMEIAAGLANALEDGRIERIRANRFPGFEKQRLVARGRFWEGTGDAPKPDAKTINAEEHLMVLLNEILSLATCQLYTKGFVNAYAGTPIVQEVNSFMPYIGKAVMSGRCRGLIDPMKQLGNMLAPYIFEVCKISKEQYETEQMFKKIMNNVVSVVFGNIDPGNSSTPWQTENTEDTDDGSINSTFPHSDMIMVLDDETYDKLFENSQNKGGSSGGIMVMREHPKEEDNESEEQTNGAGGAGQSNSSEDSESEEQTSGAGSGSETDSDESEEKNGSGSEGGNETENSEDKAGAGNEAEKEQSDPSNSASQKNSNQKDQKSSQSDSPGAKSSSGKTSSPCQGPGGTVDKHVSKATADAAAKAVEEAVKDAVKQAKNDATAEASSVITSINASTAARTKERKSGAYKNDKYPAINAKEMRDICTFREIKRSYKLTRNLPPADVAKAKVLRTKTEAYFQSKNKPAQRVQPKGIIDTSRLYGLTVGDTDIFKKKQEVNEFDGCAYLLIDNSGSMGGDKRTEACRCSGIIEDAYKSFFPMKIVAFDASGCVIHQVIKGWEEVQQKNCSWNFEQFGDYGGGTPTGKSIQVATRELLGRQEKKKLLVVMCDGGPDSETETTEAIAYARKMGIHVVGIYFEEGEVSGYGPDLFDRMFKRNYICCPLNELGKHLQKVMKDFSQS